MSTRSNMTLEVILEGQKRGACSVGELVLLCSRADVVGVFAFRAGLWATAASEARRGPVLLDDTGLRGSVYMSSRLHICAPSHPEHLWHSGGLEPAAHL